MKFFICSLIITAVSANSVFASPQSPHATFSQMKVDDGLFCQDLCRYGITGKGCDFDCKNVELVEKFEFNPDFCDVLCKYGFAHSSCSCPYDENSSNNENILVCFGFYVYHKITLNGCPECPFHGMSHHKPYSGGNLSHSTRPTGNPYAHLIQTDEDKRLADEFKNMYCGFTCKSHPERSGGYCKCGN